ncbi:MAG: hypothetical protein OYH76_04435 [Defluviicoccus sp.]|nr:hypothetical protein [Defluviicoccus sp.]MDE0275122.1 hypothetical protein [Defluviicoccus sp.]
MHLAPVDLSDGPPGEPGQDLSLEIAPVHLERARLPDPFVLPEHGLGDGLEERLLGPGRRGLATPDRGQHPVGTRARFLNVDHVEIADDLPDALSLVLAVDEEALPARGRHPDAEAPELSVAEVV